MTKNQIAYWQLKEDERSHRENEDVARRNLSETVRSHRQQEFENERSHKASEEIARANLTENNRHNLVTESISSLTANANIHKADADTALTKAKATGQSIENYVNEASKDVDIAKREADLNLTQAQKSETESRDYLNKTKAVTSVVDTIFKAVTGTARMFSLGAG